MIRECIIHWQCQPCINWETQLPYCLTDGYAISTTVMTIAGCYVHTEQRLADSINTFCMPGIVLEAILGVGNKENIKHTGAASSASLCCQARKHSTISPTLIVTDHLDAAKSWEADQIQAAAAKVPRGWSGLLSNSSVLSSCSWALRLWKPSC